MHRNYGIRLPMCLGLAAEPWLESPLGTPPFDSILLGIQAMQRKDFYVYIHYRKTDHKPFYVGKGTGNRHAATGGRNEFWKRVVAKHGFYSEIIYSDLYQKQAYQLETETIKDFRIHGFKLANLTCGGDGGFGSESAAKVEQAKRNRNESAKMSGAKRKGAKRSAETIEKMRVAASKRKQSFSERLKRSLKMRDDLHPAYKDEVHSFYNYKTGETVKLTMHQFCKETGLPKGNVHRVVNGSLNSVGRWTMSGTDASKIKPVNIKRIFWHPDHGEVHCTMTELDKAYGAPIGNMANVIAGKRKSCKGWKYLGPSLAP